MSLSTILALIDPKHGHTTLRVAEYAAEILSARVNGLAIRPDPSTAIPVVGPGPMSGDFIQMAMDYAEIDGKRHINAAKDIFDARSGAAPAGFLERIGDVGRLIAEEGRIHGLITLPCGDLLKGETDAIHSALFATGRPVIIAPTQFVDTMGSRVVIFWKDTPQAARAVWAALPFLKQSKQVRAITVDDHEHAATALSRLKTGLDYAGVTIETDCLAPSSNDAHDQLIEQAAIMNADLVVMGAYSHSRLRETVLGGVTLSTLDSLARPTLLAH